MTKRADTLLLWNIIIRPCSDMAASLYVMCGHIECTLNVV